MIMTSPRLGAIGALMALAALTACKTIPVPVPKVEEKDVVEMRDAEALAPIKFDRVRWLKEEISFSIVPSNCTPGVSTHCVIFYLKKLFIARATSNPLNS